MDLEGRVIGNRYEMIAKIGNGGMATVYKAKDLILKRFVAVKVLRDEFTTDQEFIRRFNVEAQSAASLAHPNIVSIYDVGNEENIYYIVMELIQGKTLKQIINEDGVLPWKWSLNISIQIASALETAHKNNIVHRDIKPHNIIITEEGIAKVTDFGIAKAVSNSTITAFGTTIGSVHYFSPEHARGGFTDAKSDLYSLGIVMYEMLTGRVPFDADTPVSIALKHMQEDAVEPIKLNPAIPYSVNKIILKAMKKETNTRYQTATEMLRDLGMALKNPEGNFVHDKSNTNAYTQVVPTHANEEIKIENISSRDNNTNQGKNEKKKEKSFFKSHPWVKILIIIALCILIPVGGFFVTQSLLKEGRGKDVSLPNFVDMTKEEAELKAIELGLVLEIEEQFDKEIELGKVISQEPPYIENYTVKENSTVKLVISKGANTKIVPKVTGETFEDAQKILEENELVAEKIEETSDKVEAGYVIKQEPEAKTEVNAEETVKVYVSTGPKKIMMEYVVGEKEADAKKKLEKIGFEVIVIYEEDTTKDDGIVLKQSIDTGNEVNDGTKVTLTVNKIIQIKSGTVNINLKSITGGTIEIEDSNNTEEDANAIEEDTNNIEEDTNIIEEQYAEVIVKVSDVEIYKDEHGLDSQITLTGNDGIKGKGIVDIEVLVTWSNKSRKRSGQLDLNSDNPVLNIE